MNRLIVGLVACSAALVLAAPAYAGSAAKGKRVFNRCKACHSLEPGKKLIGPSLYGVFGRTSGTLKGFPFSQTIDKYVAQPRKVVRGTRMAFPGIRNEEEREDLIAYLKEATAPKK